MEVVVWRFWGLIDMEEEGVDGWDGEGGKRGGRLGFDGFLSLFEC